MAKEKIHSAVKVWLVCMLKSAPAPKLKEVEKRIKARPAFSERRNLDIHKLMMR